jgi:UrcA family protein
MNRSFIAMAAGLTLIAGQAHADPSSGSQTISIKVTYADLDLSTDAGAREVLRRLERAARTACGGRPEFGPFMLGLVQPWEACRAGAVRGAVEAIGRPTVSRLYTGEQQRLASARR